MAYTEKQVLPNIPPGSKFAQEMIFEKPAYTDFSPL
jgi:hypothetical protein